MAKLSFSVLKHRDLRFMLIGYAAAVMALQAQAVIVGWQIYKLTHSVLHLGYIGLTEAVPAIIAALFAGHFVDKGKPHRIYVSCLAGLSVNTLMLFLFAGGHVQLKDGLLVPVIFTAVFMSGLMRSFMMPCLATLIGKIVPREEIPAATAWRMSAFQFSAVTGPAIAGLIYGGYGEAVAWAIPTCLMLVAVFMIASMGQETKHYKNPPRPEKTMESIKTGWSFILKSPVLLSVMALDMFAVLFGGAVAVLPAFADQVLHLSAEGLGLLRASPAIGSVITALLLAVYPMKSIKPQQLLIVVAGFGLSMIGFGLSSTFTVAAFCLALSGAFDSVSVVIRGTLVQWLTPDEMRGRVASVNSMFIISSNEIGAFESGLAASLLGLVPSLIMGGMGTLIVVAATAYLCPQIRKGEIHPHQHHKV